LLLKNWETSAIRNSLGEKAGAMVVDIRKQGAVIKLID